MQDNDIVHTYSVPRSFAEDAMRYDMLQELQTSVKPKLFIIGKEDSIVNPQEAKAWYVCAGEPKQLVIVDAYDHNYRNFPEVIEQINKTVEQFIGEQPWDLVDVR